MRMKGRGHSSKYKWSRNIASSLGTTVTLNLNTMDQMYTFQLNLCVGMTVYVCVYVFHLNIPHTTFYGQEHGFLAYI